MSKKTEIARQGFEKAAAENKTAFDEMNYATTQLFKAREKLTVAFFFNGILNIPNDLGKDIEKASDNRQSFETSLQIAQTEVEKLNSPNGGVGVTATAIGLAGAGVVAAVGGPAAAMAIATTFGVASTGAAISGLSGAAATTAALAWLGGGAIVAGGAGMAGGMGLLIAIPVIGVVLAGLAVTGACIFGGFSEKNIVAEYEQNAIFMEGATKMYKDNSFEISALCMETLQLETKTQIILKSIIDIDKDFSNWNKNQAQQMRELIETISEASDKLIKRIPLDLEKCNQVEYYKKRLIALSTLQNYPESPNSNIEAKVEEYGFNCTAEAANGWKLEQNKATLHYRVRSPEKKRIAWGNKKQITMFLDSVIK